MNVIMDGQIMCGRQEGTLFQPLDHRAALVSQSLAPAPPKLSRQVTDCVTHRIPPREQDDEMRKTLSPHENG
jgi:hypothetical protein